MSFNIGDDVFVAIVKWNEKRIQCPDCFGKRFLTVILGDGEAVTVDCPECSSGYLGSLGDVAAYDYEAMVECCTVTGMEQTHTDSGVKMRYHVNGHHGMEQENIFASSDDAAARAAVLAAELSQERDKRFAAKEKPNKSWAWNATYHRGCIRRAEKDLAYHQSKLEMAKEARNE